MIQFIEVSTYSKFQESQINNDSIVFIKDIDAIWAKGEFYYCIPKSGNALNVAVNKSSGNMTWKNVGELVDLKDILAYGVQWDTSVSDPQLSRVGNLEMHKTLPIQSQLKGCIARGSDIRYWLNEEDWRWRRDPIIVNGTVSLDIDSGIVSDVFNTLQYEGCWIKINGNEYKISSINTEAQKAHIDMSDFTAPGEVTIELGAVLNGYDGSVRVYVPEFYIREFTSGTTRQVYISTVQIDKSWTKQPACLVDAYRCTQLHEIPSNMGYITSLPINSMVSIMNTNAYCRGGMNRPSYDQYLSTDPIKTDLGKPIANISRSAARTFAKQADSHIMSYEEYKNIFYWLYVIEYANFNVQLAFNPALTSDGFHQGGLGKGVTAFTSTWHNSYNNTSLVYCGITNDTGNGTNSTQFTADNQDNDSTVVRWRGFENTFGDVWLNLDGVVVNAKKTEQSTYKDVYIITDSDKFVDTIEEAKNNYTRILQTNRAIGFISQIFYTEQADILPSVCSGTESTYMCDNYNINYDSQENTILVGGLATDQSQAGLLDLNLDFLTTNGHNKVTYRTVSYL